MPAHKTKADERLLGTWRSDRRRTLKEWVWERATTAKQRKFITDAFGHLTVRYTRQRMLSDFKGQKKSTLYDVLGADWESVAIMAHVDWMGEPRIYHIHFEDKDHYWVSFGGHREWFRRVGENKTGRR